MLTQSIPLNPMDKAFIATLFDKQKTCKDCPSPEEIKTWLQEVLSCLFPEFTKPHFKSEKELLQFMLALQNKLESILERMPIPPIHDIKDTAKGFFEQLPQLLESMENDVQAIFDGDPAAKSRTEIVRTYPGFYAIAVHRIAHALHGLGIQLIPRFISEHAHSLTGIDIHPGASIGEHFCIDHGTGVVIGETSVIGNHVKIYQGVTLGGLSVDKKDASTKRHPTIEDHVVIYAGATILGGKTTIGHHSIIGGNVWLTQSATPYSKIYYKANLTDQDGKTDTIIFRGTST